MKRQIAVAPPLSRDLCGIGWATPALNARVAMESRKSKSLISEENREGHNFIRADTCPPEFATSVVEASGQPPKILRSFDQRFDAACHFDPDFSKPAFRVFGMSERRIYLQLAPTHSRLL